MARRFILGMMWAANSTLGGGASAQEFRILDHDHGPSAMSTADGYSSNDTSRSADPTLALHATVPGYRKATYLPLVRQAELRHRLPPRLLQALIWAESRFNPLSVSPAGAAGLAQLMPATALELGVTNRHDPQQNIEWWSALSSADARPVRIGASCACRLYAGPGAVTKTGGIPRNRETPGYVRSVLNRRVSYAK